MSGLHCNYSFFPPPSLSCSQKKEWLRQVFAGQEKFRPLRGVPQWLLCYLVSLNASHLLLPLTTLVQLPTLCQPTGRSPAAQEGAHSGDASSSPRFPRRPFVSGRRGHLRPFLSCPRHRQHPVVGRQLEEGVSEPLQAESGTFDQQQQQQPVCPSNKPSDYPRTGAANVHGLFGQVLQC